MIGVTRCLGVYTIVTLSIVVTAHAACQSNPGYMKFYAFIPVYSVSTGEVIDTLEVSEYTSGYGSLRTYNRYYSNYDGHNTNPGAQPYGHGHAERDFPWVGRVNGTQPPSITVTSEMVDEAHMYVHPGHNVVASATCAFNCHGLSMLKGWWVLSETLYGGAIIVIYNEYEPGAPPAANRFFLMESGTFGTFEHSYVASFTSFGSPPVYAQTSVIEKFNTGPIMTGGASGSSSPVTIQRKHQ